MIVLAIWSLANALEMTGADLSTKLFWANMQYTAYCYSPVTLIALCTKFTGYSRWLKGRNILWLAVLPTVIILLVWTNSMHGLIRYDVHMDFSGPFPVIAKKYGPFFYVHSVYSHLLNIIAWVLLCRAAFFNDTVYRKQALSLLLGVSLIIIPNILYIFHLFPSYRFDVTPAFFGPAGLITAWAIFRFKLFDVVPVAWAKAISMIDAGVIVLDMQDRVLDMNPAFQNIIGCAAASSVLTKQVAEVCGEIPELKQILVDNKEKHTEFSFRAGETVKTYEVLLSPLTDNKGRPVGKFAIIYEITERKRQQQELSQQQWKLAGTEERERMARDLHDNLGQILGFINMQAQGIRQELKNAGIETAAEQLNKLVDVTQSAHNELRKYIGSIRNSAFQERDFITALKKNIADFEEQSGLKVTLNYPESFSTDILKPNVRIYILNIVKEALNNVCKHAEADKVIITISLKQDLLCVAVEDNGKGFDVSKSSNTNKTTKFGLEIMRERASEIGGKLDIESTQGKGSRIILQTPFNEG
ncbi:hypothetical protein SDC9_58275 [bioreactor metagenome]|uniref:histidine kinase n=1 Tax=bioreactor metagenome TaxID=1076179 RepID=A0A644XCL0_9ZZZZ